MMLVLVMVGCGVFLLQCINFITELCVLRCEVACAAIQLRNLCLQRIFLLLLTINTACKISILCLELGYSLSDQCDFFLCLLVRSLRLRNTFFNFFVLPLQDLNLLLRLFALLLRQYPRVSFICNLCLKILSLALQGVHLLVLGCILCLLFLQLNLVQAQGIHQSVDLVCSLAALVRRAMVFPLQVLIRTLCSAKGLLQRVSLYF
mmetsp:Transcript_57628/g.114373  ORF Transcript_57628/g.114373 Transcript_57628/m.114373 type:complete len:205 (-) Transcript_57628:354-968(-)